MKLIVLLFTLIFQFSGVISQQQLVDYGITSRPLEWVDSVYQENGIDMKDTSRWQKVVYDSNKGRCIQYNDLYEVGGQKMVFSIIRVEGDSLYRVQFIKE